jgi:hypothetical protein
VETLVREPVAVPTVDLPTVNGAPAAPAEEGSAPAPIARHCASCGVPMSPTQDWCLECGTAAPGRLGGRPGRRAALTVLVTTLALACGAVAASYAALSSDAHRSAAAPPPPAATPIAQQAPSTPAVPVAQAPAPTAPPVLRGIPGLPANRPVIPILPRNTVPVIPPAAVRPVPTPTPVTPVQAKPRPAPKPKPAAPQPIALGADAVRLYDPYGSAVAKGDPADAYDKDLGTSWFVTSKNSTGSMAVGLVIDLEKARRVQTVALATSTPGYTVEVYGAPEGDLPPDVLDARWSHLVNRSKVDETKRDGSNAGDGAERIALRSRAGTYRYMLLWFTTQPASGGPTVRISELSLIG